MKQNDVQLGAPSVIYKDTKANIEALSIAEGAVAYATDTDQLGTYTGAAWQWVALGAVTAHNVLSAQHGDALADTVVAGDVIIGNATPKWSRLAAGLQHQVLKMGAAVPAWASFDWDDISTAVGADMAHDHSSAAEGGTLPPATPRRWRVWAGV